MISFSSLYYTRCFSCEVLIVLYLNARDGLSTKVALFIHLQFLVSLPLPVWNIKRPGLVAFVAMTL